jgi:hypothetical protein
METKPRQTYEPPRSCAVAVNLKAGILQASKPDYIPELW